MDNLLGGMYYKDKICSIVEDHIGPKENILEVCCGCGVIGKAILQNDLAQNVTFSDIQDLSHDHINFIQSDGLQSITDKYELIICSPPWYNSELPPAAILNHMAPVLWQDKDWKFHKQFYKDVTNNLTDNGSVLITNCFDSRKPSEWKDMCSLTLRDIFIYDSHILRNKTIYPRNYVLWWQNDK